MLAALLRSATVLDEIDDGAGVRKVPAGDSSGFLLTVTRNNV